MAVIFFSFLSTTWFSCLGIQCRPKLTRDWQQHNRLGAEQRGQISIMLIPPTGINFQHPLGLQQTPKGSPFVSLSGKESSCNVGDPGSIPGSRRFPGEGNGNPSSILAWGIPWTERSLAGYSP